MTTELHPIATEAMRLALRPKAEAARLLEAAASGDVAALDIAHRDLCRRLGARPDDIPASEALRLVHDLRDRLRGDRGSATSIRAEPELART